MTKLTLAPVNKMAKITTLSCGLYKVCGKVPEWSALSQVTWDCKEQLPKIHVFGYFNLWPHEILKRYWNWKEIKKRFLVVLNQCTSPWSFKSVSPKMREWCKSLIVEKKNSAKAIYLSLGDIMKRNGEYRGVRKWWKFWFFMMNTAGGMCGLWEKGISRKGIQYQFGMRVLKKYR